MQLRRIKIANNYWLEQEKKFKEAIKVVEIPDNTLKDVDFLIIKSLNDAENIPKGGGCYWIWTNEPVIHSLHNNEVPAPFDGGEVIYNGIAQDNVRERIIHHLFGDEDAGWSGISMDIYKKPSQSHRKKACSPTGKVPFINKIPIKCAKQLLNLHLSRSEKTFIKKSKEDTFYFRNGINLNDKKHKKYNYRVYFITGLKSLYLEHIEKEWRSKQIPKLCSYKTGR